MSTPGQRFEWAFAKLLFAIFVALALAAMAEATLARHRCEAACEASGFKDVRFAPPYRAQPGECRCLAEPASGPASQTAPPGQPLR